MTFWSIYFALLLFALICLLEQEVRLIQVKKRLKARRNCLKKSFTLSADEQAERLEREKRTREALLNVSADIALRVIVTAAIVYCLFDCFICHLEDSI